MEKCFDQLSATDKQASVTTTYILYELPIYIDYANYYRVQIKKLLAMQVSRQSAKKLVHMGRQTKSDSSKARKTIKTTTRRPGHEQHRRSRASQPQKALTWIRPCARTRCLRQLPWILETSSPIEPKMPGRARNLFRR